MPGLVPPTTTNLLNGSVPLPSGSVLCRRLGVPSVWASPWTCCSHQPLVSEYAARYPLRGRFLRQISELPSSDGCPNSCSSTSALPHAAMTLPSEPTTTLAKAYHAFNPPSGLLLCAELEAHERVHHGLAIRRGASASDSKNAGLTADSRAGFSGPHARRLHWPRSQEARQAESAAVQPCHPRRNWRNGVA